tara:strand:- start:11415 stop:12377 length:963 start_codon:yes stop_codon:yes gene_type:complete
MKILVTGAAGFIGYNLCTQILNEFKNVNLYGIDSVNNYYSVKIKKLRISNLEKYENFSFDKINIDNRKKLDKYFKKKNFDYIFHLAAQAGVRYSIEQPRKYLNANTIGFFNLLENCKSKNIKRIFYASSSSVYGDSNKFPLSEKQIIKPINYYGLTKKNNEETAEIFSKYYGLKLIGLRFFTVYGEWGRPDMVIFKLLESIFKKKIFKLNNKGNHFRDFTYIEDVTGSIIKLMKAKIKEKHLVINVCSNKPIKLTYLIKHIQKKKLNLKYKKVSFQKADIYKTHGDNSVLISKIGKIYFTSLKVGLNRCIEWYKNYYKKI